MYETVDLESYLLGEVENPPSWLSQEGRVQAEAARAFVCGEGDPPKELQLEVGLALCCALAARGDTEKLTRLAAEGSKSLAKEARRTLHLLRTRGVSVAPVARSEFRPMFRREISEPEPPSFVTAVDRFGERGVWLCRRALGKGILIFEATVSDTRGLVHFVAGRTTRKGYRSISEKIRTRARGVEVPSSYARWLIEEAYRLSESLGRGVPEEFALVRSEMGPITETYEEHPAIRQWPSVEPLPDEDLRAILEVKELYGWIPDEESLKTAALKIGEVMESRVVVSEEQRREALKHALVRVASAYFTREKRALFRRRLLDTAWFVHLAGRRNEEALRLRRAAESFVGAPGSEPNPLEYEFFARLFGKKQRKEEKMPEPSGGLIIAPGEGAESRKADEV